LQHPIDITTKYLIAIAYIVICRRVGGISVLARQHFKIYSLGYGKEGKAHD
jgi:hypothetical protein